MQAQTKTVQAIQTHQATTIQVQTHPTVQTVIRVHQTSTRTFTVKIPDTADDSVDVEIVANGKTVHNAVHSKDEGTVSVEITGSGTAEVQAYIDGSKVSDRTINFN